MPHGISQARKGEWSFGMLPQSFSKQVFAQAHEKARHRSLQTVDRDVPPRDHATDKAKIVRTGIDRQRSSDPEPD